MDGVYTPREYEPSLVEKISTRHKKEPGKDSFSVVIPPPNITNILHLGHTFNATVQDIFIRHHALKGKNTLFKLGIDHAGIGTQVMVEKHLWETEKKTRQDFTKEELRARIWEWKETYGDKILQQMKTLGLHADWEDIHFTLSPHMQEATYVAFETLYKKNWIYRDTYMVNFCERCHTALSDEEVDSKEIQGNMYYVLYELVDPLACKEKTILVATTRPETILADVALAVHPEDERYQDYIGKEVYVPSTQRRIPILADEYVDPVFGTGVLKITPAHDMNDFLLGKKHQLPVLDLFDTQGQVSELGGSFAGMKREEFKKHFLQILEQQHLLDRVEPHMQSVGHCSRCQQKIEPRISTQWFLSLKEIAPQAIEAVENGSITFTPEKWKKVYMHWMQNIKDWCISRQLVWGHSIPVYHCQSCGHMQVARTQPSHCEKCEHREMAPDPDVLDTWFTSWLWPFAVQGWPQANWKDTALYPTSFLVTAPEILFFWVARMIMSSLIFVQEIPFQQVYFTPTIADMKGRKMSKSLGNGIDPLEIAEKYGVDALRFSLLFLAPKTDYIRLDESKFLVGYKFMNKLWNLGKLVKNLLSQDIDSLPSDTSRLWTEDPFHHWLDKAWEDLETKLDYAYRENQVHFIAQNLYEFAWNLYCDWYSEWMKISIHQSKTKEERVYWQKRLQESYEKLLLILHPMIPYLTTYSYEQVLGANQTLLERGYIPPVSIDSLAREKSFTQVEKLKTVIEDIRSIKAIVGLGAGQKISLTLCFDHSDDVEFHQQYATWIVKMASLDKFSVVLLKEEYLAQQKEAKTGILMPFVGGCYFILDNGAFHLQDQVSRLQKEYTQNLGVAKGLQSELANADFLARADEGIIAQKKNYLHELTTKNSRIEQILNYIKGES